MPIPAKDVADVIDAMRSVASRCPGWFAVERVVRDYQGGTIEGALQYVDDAGADETHVVQTALAADADITADVLDALQERAYDVVANRMANL